MTEISLNLYQKRNKAKKIVYEHEFTKVKTGGLQYAYMPIEAIKPIVENAYNEAGIVIDIVSLEHHDVKPPEERQGYEGTKSTWFYVRGTLTLELVNIDDPEDTARVVVVGEAKDNSDKVINKVYTAALKNFYKIEFNISEGPKDDTDAIQSDADLDKKTTKTKEKPKTITPESNDKFFKKTTPPAPTDGILRMAEAIFEEPTDAVLNNGLMKASKDPKYAPLIKGALELQGATSIIQLDREIKLSLRNKIAEGE